MISKFTTLSYKIYTLSFFFILLQNNIFLFINYILISFEVVGLDDFNLYIKFLSSLCWKDIVSQKFRSIINYKLYRKSFIVILLPHYWIIS